MRVCGKGNKNGRDAAEYGEFHTLDPNKHALFRTQANKKQKKVVAPDETNFFSSKKCLQMKPFYLEWKNALLVIKNLFMLILFTVNVIFTPSNICNNLSSRFSFLQPCKCLYSV